tara:strand:+ start:322 stop:594 length:273 start_codon:yes stop_codon:yes gene_type:complete
MPFQADSRCGLMNIEFNVNVILEELEEFLEKEYTESIDEGSKFWKYVEELEQEYVSWSGCPCFWDWFPDNFNNLEIPMWKEIKGNFVDVE